MVDLLVVAVLFPLELCCWLCERNLDTLQPWIWYQRLVPWAYLDPQQMTSVSRGGNVTLGLYHTHMYIYIYIHIYIYMYTTDKLYTEK